LAGLEVLLGALAGQQRPGVTDPVPVGNQGAPVGEQLVGSGT
jgi:hypothetical protein